MPEPISATFEYFLRAATSSTFSTRAPAVARAPGMAIVARKAAATPA